MATLKNLVDETTNIKDELVECHANLKNNLIEKGIEVLNSDKIPSLIEKIKQLKKIKVEIGTKSYALVYNSKTSTKSNSYTEILSYTMLFEGSININFSMTGSSSDAGYLQIYKNEEMLNSYTKTGTTTTNYSLDVDINENDVIKFIAKTGATLNILNLAFSCDFVY